jgi:hypothetical protein
MTLQEKLEQATKYLQGILKLFAPKDTGNLSLNAIRMSQVAPNEWQIIIGGEIAPYAVYTNEKWGSPRWGGKRNPNEGWVNRAIESATPNLNLILGGKITISEVDTLLKEQQIALQQQLNLLAEEVDQ